MNFIHTSVHMSFDIPSSAFVLPPPCHERVLRCCACDKSQESAFWASVSGRLFSVAFFRSWCFGAPRRSNCPRHVSVLAFNHGAHQPLYFQQQKHWCHRLEHFFIISVIFLAKLPVWDGRCWHSRRIPDSQTKVCHFMASPAPQRIQEFLPGCWSQHDFPTALPGPSRTNAELKLYILRFFFERFMRDIFWTLSNGFERSRAALNSSNGSERFWAVQTRFLNYLQTIRHYFKLPRTMFTLLLSAAPKRQTQTNPDKNEPRASGRSWKNSIRQCVPGLWTPA